MNTSSVRKQHGSIHRIREFELEKVCVCVYIYQYWPFSVNASIPITRSDVYLRDLLRKMFLFFNRIFWFAIFFSGEFVR